MSPLIRFLLLQFLWTFSCTPLPVFAILEKDNRTQKEKDAAEAKATDAAVDKVALKSDPLDPKVPLMVPSEYEKIVDTKYTLFPHRGTFVMPYTYNWRTHNDIYSSIQSQPNQPQRDYYDNEELEFQISFMLPVSRKMWDTNWDLLFAYTHHAWWQLYNGEWSKPFRETNYSPEIFGRYLFKEPRQFARFRIFAADVGVIHQSNGQFGDLSRSWDRVIGRVYMKSPYVFMILSGWYRKPDGADDDNANIQRYMGYGELELYKLWANHSWSVKVPLSERPGVELRYSYPWKHSLRWFVNYKTGYGHSMIEYNRYTDRIGVGIALESFLDSPQIDTPEKED